MITDTAPNHTSQARLRSGISIGVDVGQRHLLTAAPATEDPEVNEALVLDSKGATMRYEAIQHRYHTQSRDTDGLHVAALEGILTTAAQQVLSYAQSFDAPPILVLEDLTYPDRTLEECVRKGMEAACWLLPTIQQRLVDLSRSESVPIATVSAKHSTQECHACGELAWPRKKIVQCTTEACSAGRVCRDRSAAATLAKRFG